MTYLYIIYIYIVYTYSYTKQYIYNTIIHARNISTVKIFSAVYTSITITTPFK